MEMDGTPQNDGLIFCCRTCKKIHIDHWQDTQKWYREVREENVIITPHRDGYRNLCFQCEHFLNLEPNSQRRGVWYNHVCTKDFTPIKLDGEDDYSENTKVYCRDAISHCVSIDGCEIKEMVETEVSRFDLMEFNDED